MFAIFFFVDGLADNGEVRSSGENTWRYHVLDLLLEITYYFVFEVLVCLFLFLHDQQVRESFGNFSQLLRTLGNPQLCVELLDVGDLVDKSTVFVRQSLNIFHFLHFLLLFSLNCGFELGFYLAKSVCFSLVFNGLFFVSLLRLVVVVKTVDLLDNLSLHC